MPTSAHAAADKPSSLQQDKQALTAVVKFWNKGKSYCTEEKLKKDKGPLFSVYFRYLMRCLGKGTWSQITEEGHHTLSQQGNICLGRDEGQLAAGKGCSGCTEQQSESGAINASSAAKGFGHGTRGGVVSFQWHCEVLGNKRPPLCLVLQIISSVLTTDAFSAQEHA